MGALVGPGRGTSASSIVLYCLYITNIDPVKYNLLFERFLNPSQISMLDIDIDCDVDGRIQILQWVKEKYGHKRVAYIVDFDIMDAKSAIKDVARVYKLPRSSVNRLCKLIDEIPPNIHINIKNAIAFVPDMKKAYHSPNIRIANTIQYAQMLEGTLRRICIYPCGIIISPDDLTNFVPVCTFPDGQTYNGMFITQYSNSLRYPHHGKASEGDLRNYNLPGTIHAIKRRSCRIYTRTKQRTPKGNKPKTKG
jgi:DNA polymerase-3 subunit alpha